MSKSMNKAALLLRNNFDRIHNAQAIRIPLKSAGKSRSLRDFGQSAGSIVANELRIGRDIVNYR
jgi:energy-coupling factor transporter transmembrane protein EcfT